MNRQPVRFSQEQIAFINELFPELTHSANSTEAQLRWSAATRFVVKTIEANVERPGDIPR